MIGPVPHLGRHLSRWLAVLSMMGLGAVSLAVYVVFDGTLSSRQQETMDQKQRSLAHVLADGSQEHKDKTLEHTLTDFLAGHDDYAIAIVGSDGKMLYDSRVASLAESDTVQRTFPISISSDKTHQAQNATATLVMDRRPDDELLRSLAWTFVASMVAGSFILSVIGMLLVRRSLRPIDSLVNQISSLSAKDLERRLEENGLPQELLPLVTQFNALLDRLADAYRQLEAFNADVAHELNTPLATLISGTEVVLRKPRTIAEMREILETNLEDLRRIAGIVGDMLFLSRADRGAGARQTTLASLAEIARDVAEFYEAVALEANLKLEIVGDSSAEVDIPLIRRAISNLLSNATRYADSASTITIEVQTMLNADEKHSMSRLTVSNVGKDIDPKHIRHLFERFYRADAARHNTERNHGLGLAIVKAIAAMHGGRVFCESSDGITKMGFVLPSDIDG